MAQLEKPRELAQEVRARGWKNIFYIENGNSLPDTDRQAWQIWQWQMWIIYTSSQFLFTQEKITQSRWPFLDGKTWESIHNKCRNTNSNGSYHLLRGYHGTKCLPRMFGLPCMLGIWQWPGHGGHNACGHRSFIKMPKYSFKSLPERLLCTLKFETTGYYEHWSKSKMVFVRAIQEGWACP